MQTSQSLKSVTFLAANIMDKGDRLHLDLKIVLLEVILSVSTPSPGIIA